MMQRDLEAAQAALAAADSQCAALAVEREGLVAEAKALRCAAGAELAVRFWGRLAICG